MLRFTKETDYALIAMQYIAQHGGGGAVAVKRIAAQFDIPPQLLAKVLQRLSKRGLVASHGGPRGGYQLTLPPSEVTLRGVIEALEGPLAIVTCLNHEAACAQTTRCTVRRPAWQLQAALVEMLDSTTLAHLIAYGVPARRDADESAGLGAHATLRPPEVMGAAEETERS